MKMIAVAVVAVIAAVAAAGFAWQRNQALAETKAELANANSQLQKAQSDMLAMKAETAALRKEFDELKVEADRSRADLATTQSFLDAEKSAGAHLRAELMKANEQLAAMGRSRSAQGTPATVPAAPMVRMLPVKPMVIQQGPSGVAAGAAAPAK